MHSLYLDYNDGFQSESSAYVIMDFVDGKEMFEVINELGHYSELHAKLLFKQLLSAIEYMHRHGVCHRDLKPHNILCVKGIHLHISQTRIQLRSRILMSVNSVRITKSLATLRTVRGLRCGPILEP